MILVATQTNVFHFFASWKLWIKNIFVVSFYFELLHILNFLLCETKLFFATRSYISEKNTLMVKIQINQRDFIFVSLVWAKIIVFFFLSNFQFHSPTFHEKSVFFMPKTFYVGVVSVKLIFFCVTDLLTQKFLFFILMI